MIQQAEQHWDVVIIGGGPAGTTVGTLLRKYAPQLSVAILEKAKFPRDHVGESQLPGVSQVLNEMGCWEKVEAAGFPIKIGASYTWGKQLDKWDFDFYPVEQFVDEPRPAQYRGQRLKTAFQVDRYVYDEILLRHAQEKGVEVFEETKVEEVLKTGDRIDGLVLDSGATVTAKHYVDASGNIGVLRRAMGVETWSPKELRNIAIWNYWENAEWAVEIGVGGTRVQVRSLPYGWIWFIPLGPTRTSIGLICPSEHYRKMGISPKELYEQALDEQDDIKALIKNAKPQRDDVETTKDWSYISKRCAGANWFLTGEASGFADPILAAGMNLAHQAARDLAYTINEMEHELLHPDWLRNRYDERTRHNIEQHVRFAQFWYASNGRFTDLQDHCANIASEAGLQLSPKEAWRWLSQGGFANEIPGVPFLGSFDIHGARDIIQIFDSGFDGPEKEDYKYEIDTKNVFKLNLKGAKETIIGVPSNGRIIPTPCYERDGLKLPKTAWYEIVLDALRVTPDAANLLRFFQARISASPVPKSERTRAMDVVMQALESMIVDGWVEASHDPTKPLIKRSQNTQLIRTSKETAQAAATRPKLTNQ